MRILRSTIVCSIGAGLLLATGCASSVPAAPVATASPVDRHGTVTGAAEVGEPQLALVSVAGDGAVGLLDLLSGDVDAIGSVSAPRALASDGRYAFVTTGTGVEIVDSGRWSWDHGDHFHYYLAQPRIIGSVAGEGAAHISTGMLSSAGATAILFEGSDEAVLLDNKALSEGEVREVFRIAVDGDPVVAAPLGTGAVVAGEERLVFYDRAGEPTGAAVECKNAAGSLTTRVGLAITCDDGAVLATWAADAPTFTRIPYPTGVDAPRASSLDARKGRPTVAGLAGGAGFWLLDTRRATWEFVATDEPLARVTAVDDADGHVVALDKAGRVRVFLAATGEQIALTEPLVADVTSSVSITVDDQRAYLNDPSTGRVHEIDYADRARVARTLTTPTAPLFVAEVGR